jgi:hypothetical protein
MTTYNVEVTDTFGGEANYCWVHRHTFEAPADATQATLVRRAKALEGWTGIKCDTSEIGECIDVRPRRAAMVMFITAQY